MASCNIYYLRTGIEFSVLQLLKTAAGEEAITLQAAQDEAIRFKGFENLAQKGEVQN
jgi:hypothetical protein